MVAALPKKFKMEGGRDLENGQIAITLSQIFRFGSNLVDASEGFGKMTGVNSKREPEVKMSREFHHFKCLF